MNLGVLGTNLGSWAWGELPALPSWLSSFGYSKTEGKSEPRMRGNKPLYVIWILGATYSHMQYRRFFKLILNWDTQISTLSKPLFTRVQTAMSVIAGVIRLPVGFKANEILPFSFFLLASQLWPLNHLGIFLSLFSKVLLYRGCSLLGFLST